MSQRSGFSYFGMAAPIVYVIATVLGAALYPGYSHLRDTISSLTNPAAPNLLLLNLLYSLYNLCAILFGIGWALQSTPAAARASSVMVGISGLIGLVLVLFPQDPMGTPLTAVGTLHIALAGLLSLLTMAIIATRGAAEARERGHQARAAYSFISLTCVAATGALAAVGVGRSWPVGGLLERLTIGCYLQWLLVQALFYRHHRNATARFPRM